MSKILDKFYKFDISLFEFKEFIDEETALMLVKVCSSGDNLHGLPFTKETLKEAAERSLRGKPIVGKFSNWAGDFEGHEPSEVPIGYFVEHQQLQYIDNEDGSCSLFAYAVLWKTYASKEYELFVNNAERGKAPIKGVSMEIKVGASEEGWEGDLTKTEIKKFSFKGVTILGDKYTPASPGAQAEMVSFSKTKKRELEKYFTDNSDKINNIKDSRSLFGKFYSELGLSANNTVEKEGKLMPETEDGKNTEELEKEKDMSVEPVAETPEKEFENPEETQKEEKEEDAKEEEAEDFKAKYEEMMTKYSELETCNATYMAENATLKAYKFEREENDKNFTIEETLSKFSDILPKEVLEEYRNRKPDVKYSEITAFCNEIKARIVDFVDVKKDVNTNRMAIGQPMGAKKQKSEFIF